MVTDKIFELANILKEKKHQLEVRLSDVERSAKEILLKAKEEALNIQRSAEREVNRLTSEAIELEKRLQKKQSEIETLRKKTDDGLQKVQLERKELSEKKDEILLKLEKIAKLTREEARELILKGWEEKLKPEIAKRIKESQEEIKRRSEEEARQILVDAIRYGAVDYLPEYTLSTVTIPSEDVKGRIIGKEGRNIRAFELSTGVDVDLEEEGIIKLSSFDSVRREIAKVAMGRLIRDGRIQPQRIEEIVRKTTEDIEKEIVKAGEELCHKVGVYNLPFEIMKLLGRFKYRYSYGQNMVLHTLEETKIGTALAYELKADVDTVKLGCLLHDIGKVITDKEGSHVTLGVDFLKKHNISDKVVSCVASHHEDVPFESLEAVIVYIADAVSGGRPAARHEDFQEYLKRIKTIEEVAKSKKGVGEVYALQAGRELRVIVKPEEVDDDDMAILAEKIKEEIEKKFPTFPGQVKITIIRELRALATSHS